MYCGGIHASCSDMHDVDIKYHVNGTEATEAENELLGLVQSEAYPEQAMVVGCYVPCSYGP